MKLKILFILGLFLCLGRVANSNECSRHCPKAAARCTRSAADKPSEAGSAAASRLKANDNRSESARNAGEVSDYSPAPLIRLLYI
ncbi:MAG TPA: hypothetical protein VNU72_12795 [Puia sp.]|nr:hypothetical protein [Puia sp.]